MDWLAIAKTLRVNTKVRVPHECGEGKRATINHTMEGYGFSCFGCYVRHWKPHGEQNVTQLLQRLRYNDAEAKATLRLPRCDESVHPDSHFLWLINGGITNRLRTKYGIYWSAHIERTVIPVYDSGSLRYWQARSVRRNHTPKYINPPIDKKEVLFNSAEVGSGSLPKMEECIVTEDILSAIRVGNVGSYDGISLLGTKASRYHINRLSEYKRVHIWLDPDKAGLLGRGQLARYLERSGIPYSVVRSTKDPKCYSSAEILRIIEEQEG